MDPTTDRHRRRLLIAALAVGLVLVLLVGGQRVASAYAHMWEHSIHASVGDRVTAGQHIGDVGSSGRSTGAHLHFEIRPGGTNATAIDAKPWLADHGAEGIQPGDTRQPGCAPGGDAAPPGAFPAGTPTRSWTIPPATVGSPLAWPTS